MSAQDYMSYFQKMPWLAVTMENMDSVAQLLGPRYHVDGIPHFVILDGDDATVYTLDGRGKVMQDPYALEFPYRGRSLVPKSVKKMLSNVLLAVRLRFKSLLRVLMPKFLWKLFGL